MAESDDDSCFISTIEVDYPSDNSSDASDNDLEGSELDLASSNEEYHGVIQGYMFEPVLDHSSGYEPSQSSEQVPQGSPSVHRTQVDPTEWYVMFHLI